MQMHNNIPTLAIYENNATIKEDQIATSDQL